MQCHEKKAITRTNSAKVIFSGTCAFDFSLQILF